MIRMLALISLAVLPIGIFSNWFGTTQIAHAYSITSDPSASASTSFDIRNGWDELMTPMQSFITNLGSINTSDLRTTIDPSTQIQAMIPAEKINVFLEILSVISATTQWLTKMADKIIQLILQLYQHQT
jgi:hypothetical protein